MTELNTFQKNTLLALKQRIGTLSVELSALSALSGSSKNNKHPEFYKPTPSNAIGIFGARGAGKSTLLLTLFHRYQQKKCAEEDAHKEFNGLSDKLLFIDPIDCSILGPNTSPSAIVLLAIKTSLQTHNLRKIGLEHCKDKLIKPLDTLDSLIGKCTRTEKAYRKLFLELSTSPEDYDYYQEKGIQERFELEHEIGNCIKDISKAIGDKTFVVLLDDFDLTSVKQVHAWIHALLDELKQFGLIFVVTADYFRLEHLSWDSKKQCDDKTGRALINKIFPPQNCIQIPEWSVKDSLEFSLSLNSDTLENRLDELLFRKNPSVKPIVWNLLPPLPRGIENLYNKLTSIQDSTDEPEHLVLDFIIALATCRNEPLLARRLKEPQIRSWLLDLPFSKNSCGVEEWQALVKTAYERPQFKADQQSKCLSHLHSLLKKSKTPKKNTNGQKAALLHKHEYTHPLRDAIAVDQSLWAELLLDMDFQKSIDNRTLFFSVWKPLAKRIEQTQFQLPLTNYILRAFFDNSDSVLTKSNLIWLKHEDKHLSIGWQPLSDALQGKRDPLSLDLFTKLNVNPRHLQGDLPTKEFLGIIPNSLWSLIVFTDALERCAWQEFSATSIWMIGTYIFLAAAFVRTAYVYSLVRSNILNFSELSKIQQTFVGILEKRDASDLFIDGDKDEKVVLDKLAALFEDGLFVYQVAEPNKITWTSATLNPALVEHGENQPVHHDQNPLVIAASHYFASPMYRDAIVLLEDTFDFYGIRQ